MKSETSEQETLPVAHAKAGDAEAWNTLLKRFRLPLYIYVYQMVRDEHASYDIVQETFISAIRHIADLQSTNRFASWLYGIAHQKSIQLWRRQNREEDALKELAEIPIEFDDDPRQSLIRQEQKARFLRLLEELSATQRSVLVLYFMENFTLDEIATITNTSLGTVKSRLHYAKKAFKELWEKENV